MKKIKRLVIPVLTAAFGVGLFSATSVYALRDIDPIDFYVSYSYDKDVPGDAYKVHDGQTDAGKYVVNLTESPGSANVTTTLHNVDHAYRGSGIVQRGTRASFYNVGYAGYTYHLNLKRTYSGGDIYVKGSWSPDSQD
ncbi:hypothetical protein [Ectobacillus antri]|uniref:hypothetical protein n=1 Tax=Ectobacillus antri TaxID=2486280 RepID=UPI000F59D19C|nr:hypothetical protein [Ectobacillus antri]